MLAAVNLSLKPDGRLVIIEFAEGHPFGPQDKAERMTVNQIRAEIEPMGLSSIAYWICCPFNTGLFSPSVRE